MRARIIAFVVLAVALAALFVRLGVWQLDRLRARRAINTHIQRLLDAPAVPFGILKSEATQSNRRAIVEGTPDYDHEFVHTGRSRNGSPGVHVFTPVRLSDSSVVLVNRGWVYAADAATVDLARWREQGTRALRGYTREIAAGGPSSPSPKGVRAVRTLSEQAIAALLPYPVPNVYVIARDSAGDRVPARLPDPDLTEGPHLSYAIQWFCFAAIALIGAGIVLARSRTTRAG